MSYSLDFTTHADVINTELRFNQSDTTASAGLTTSTAWSSTITYGKNEVVKYNNRYWISKVVPPTLNLNQIPAPASAYWDAFDVSASASNTSMVWRGVYDNGTTYSMGDVVSQTFGVGGRGVAFVSIINSNTSNPPSGSPSAWLPISPNAVSIQPTSISGGAWVSGTRYFPNTIVSYLATTETTTGASYYVCIADTDGNTTVPPILASNSRSFWLPLDSSTFLGTWSNTATYSKDNVVLQNGTLFQSLVDTNLNNNPNTVPPTNWLAYGLKAMRVPFSATALLNNVALSVNTPVNLKTITTTNMGGVQYNYARGYGYLYISAGAFASAPTISVYLTETTAGAVPVNNSANTQFIQGTGSTTPTNTYFDLSRLVYYNPTGITGSLFLVINSTVASSTNITIIPVGALHQFAQGTTAQSQPTTTIQTTATAGVAGIEYFRAPYGTV